MLDFSNRAYGEDGISWSVVYKDEVILRGSTSSTDLMDDVHCLITYPFNASFVVLFEPGFMFYDSLGMVCSDMIGSSGALDLIAGVFEGDVCPDGFYTVPYDLSCGEGSVEVAGLPSCQDGVSGDFCVVESVAVPCGAGITNLRTGTGVAISLWAEKYTTPALCVKYNDTVCYGNLESGQGINTVNINYNGQIYHLVD